jgi:hypothetical protein
MPLDCTICYLFLMFAGLLADSFVLNLSEALA